MCCIYILKCVCYMYMYVCGICKWYMLISAGTYGA